MKYYKNIPKDILLLQELEKDLKDKGFSVKGYICDVQAETQVIAAFARVEKDYGPVTVLVNNAGVLKILPLKGMYMPT